MPRLVRTSPFTPLLQLADPAGASTPTAGRATWYAKRVSLRRLLGEDGYDELVEISHRIETGRRALLFDPASAGDRVWWSEEGRVRLTRFAPDGGELVAAVLEEGEPFGEEPRTPLSVLTDVAEVIEAGEFLWVARDTFEDLLEEYAGASVALALRLAQQRGLTIATASSARRAEQASTLAHDVWTPPAWLGDRDDPRPRERVATLLLAFGQDGQGPHSLPQVALQELALIAGLPRPAFLEALAAWIDEGACAREGGLLHVLDRARLVEAGGSR